MAKHTRSGPDEFVYSSSRSPTCEDDVESVDDKPLLEGSERSGGSFSSAGVSAVNADAMAEAAVYAPLLTKLNKPRLSADGRKVNGRHVSVMIWPLTIRGGRG